MPHTLRYSLQMGLNGPKMHIWTSERTERGQVAGQGGIDLELINESWPESDQDIAGAMREIGDRIDGAPSDG